jgi:hypothetical protein
MADRITELDVPVLTVNLPDTGPAAIENNPHNLACYCHGIIQDVTRGLATLPSCQKLESLQQKVGYLRTVARPPDQNIDLERLDTKHRKNEEKKRRRYQEARDNLTRQGIDLESTDQDELMILTELSEAVEATCEWLQAVDPKSRRDFESQDLEIVKLGSRANIEFADFFLKIHQRFHYTPEQMTQLFNEIFGRYDLSHYMTSRAAECFPVGVFSIMKAYLELADQKAGSGTFIMPSVEEDMTQAIDLIWVGPDNVFEYYQVKTCRGGQAKTRIEDITDKTVRNTVKAHIAESMRKSMVADNLRSLERLGDFVDRQKTTNLKAKAFLVSVTPDLA